MQGLFDRRGFVGAAAMTVAACAVHPPTDTAVAPDLAAIERETGGRLGVWILDTGSGRGVGWRADDRFAMCSTFKLSLAALVLREIGVGRLGGDTVLPYGKADLLDYAPVTRAHVAGGGMRAIELAEAAVTVSDNTAANLLLTRLDGPAGLTSFWRELGDKVTRLDNPEPALNRVLPGEIHDTTTPRAMAETTARLLFGDTLAPVSRARLIGWMQASTTGRNRLRAGMPPSWRVGDKTGNASGVAGMANKHNDVAVAFPPDRPPLIVSTFYEAPGSYPDARPEDVRALVRVGQIATQWAS